MNLIDCADRLFAASDLHLDDAHQKTTAAFLDWLTWVAEPEQEASSVLILGDLFESWIGDDDDSSTAQAAVIKGLVRLSASGIKLLFAHGNRDFLIGQAFSRKTGAILISEPALLIVAGHRVMAVHGDSLCTLDRPYQAFRNQVRNPSWQSEFLGLPLSKRQEVARQARQQSMAAQAQHMNQDPRVLDVVRDAVQALYRSEEFSLLLQGHTHKPRFHLSEGPNKQTRLVLSDWDFDTSEAPRGGFARLDHESVQWVEWPSRKLIDQWVWP